ncbi:ATPase AAA domain-containing protein 2B [Phytophthora boehmeriae]|uniref:ATPase AAA domain-containing protein 2B n=1 Tax=Phytophthora boehmeriae TaxID=109152 RepID=A0A8T1W9J8_9STRA|nr:ATPase AAA domain-containing protein 2B [Phytophthora boehmeriae]
MTRSVLEAADASSTSSDSSPVVIVEPPERLQMRARPVDMVDESEEDEDTDELEDGKEEENVEMEEEGEHETKIRYRRNKEATSGRASRRLSSQLNGLSSPPSTAHGDVSSVSPSSSSRYSLRTRRSKPKRFDESMYNDVFTNSHASYTESTPESVADNKKRRHHDRSRNRRGRSRIRKRARHIQRSHGDDDDSDDDNGGGAQFDDDMDMDEINRRIKQQEQRDEEASARKLERHSRSTRYSLRSRESLGSISAMNGVSPPRSGKGGRGSKRSPLDLSVEPNSAETEHAHDGDAENDSQSENEETQLEDEHDEDEDGEGEPASATRYHLRRRSQTQNGYGMDERQDEKMQTASSNVMTTRSRARSGAAPAFEADERQLRLLFEEAKRNQPSIIFFDEIDGLAPVRSAKQDQIHASIVSTLLALMDGMDSRGRVVVIGATNRLDAIDPALRRPGRFDRELGFKLPSVSERKSMLAIHSKHWNPPLSDKFLLELAEQTVGYCGADIKALCAEAALCSLRRVYPQVYASESKLLINLDKVVVARGDFVKASKKITPASHRSVSSFAAPLPQAVKGMLHGSLTKVLRDIARHFPLFPLDRVSIDDAVTVDDDTERDLNNKDDSDEGEDDTDIYTIANHDDCDKRTKDEILEVLPLAPPPPAPSLMNLTPEEQQKRKERDLHFLRELRIFLSQVLDYCYSQKLYIPFYVPVDPAAVPNYYLIVKHPMDLSTMRDKLNDEEYTCFEQFMDDIQLIVRNANVFNPKRSRTRHIAHAAGTMKDNILSYAHRFRIRQGYDLFAKCREATKRLRANPSMYGEYGKQFVKSCCKSMEKDHPRAPGKPGVRVSARLRGVKAPEISLDGVITHVMANESSKQPAISIADEVSLKEEPTAEDQNTRSIGVLARDNSLEPLVTQWFGEGDDEEKKSEEDNDVKPNTDGKNKFNEQVEESGGIESEEGAFDEGDRVFVSSRTHPGINREGGAAVVQGRNKDGTYNVKYVLGGSEKGVSVKYIRRLTDDAVMESVKIHRSATNLAPATESAAGSVRLIQDEEKMDETDYFDELLWPILKEEGWGRDDNFDIIEASGKDSGLAMQRAVFVPGKQHDGEEVTLNGVMEAMAYITADPELSQKCFGTRYAEDMLTEKALASDSSDEGTIDAEESSCIDLRQSEKTGQPSEQPEVSADETMPQAQDKEDAQQPPDFIYDEARMEAVLKKLVAKTVHWNVDKLRDELLLLNKFAYPFRNRFDREELMKQVEAHVEMMQQ